MPSPSLMTSLRTVLSIVPKQEKRKFFLLLLIAIVSAGVEILIAALIALLAAVFASTEDVLNNPHFIWLKQLSGSTFFVDPRLLSLFVILAVLLVIVFKNLLTIYQQWQVAGFSESVSKEARQHIFKFYLRAPFLWVLGTGSTELLFGLNCCIHLGQTLLTTILVCSNIFMLISLCVGLFVAAPVPALIFLGSLGGVGYIVTKWVRKYIDRCAKKSYAADHSLYATQQMAIQGIKEMRIYGREASLYKSYSSDLGIARRTKQRQLTVVKLPVSSLEILGFVTLLVVMCYLIYVQDASMARISGIMGFMAAAAWRALPVANRTVDSLSSVRTSLPYIEKVAELIEKEKKFLPELMPCFDSFVDKPVCFENRIVFDKVDFRYPGAVEDCLHDISIQIKKGQMVGIVGFSGSGKSTLVNVLSGLLPCGNGAVRIDGELLDRNNIPGWLANISYVAQSPFILDASLAENVGLSRWG